MSSLIDLSIRVYNRWFKMDIIAKMLPQIGVQCRQLKRLSLFIITHDMLIISKMFDTINANFKHITRLEIYSHFYYTFVLTSDLLRECKRLTHLTVKMFRIQEMSFLWISLKICQNYDLFGFIIRE